jgi:hypothetical protein
MSSVPAWTGDDDQSTATLLSSDGMLPAGSLMMLSIGNCSQRGRETGANEEAGVHRAIFGRRLGGSRRTFSE